jgi:hypothetical protein
MMSQPQGQITQDARPHARVEEASFDVITRSKHELQVGKSSEIKSHGKANSEKKRAPYVSYDETKHCLLLQSIIFLGVTDSM